MQFCLFSDFQLHLHYLAFSGFNGFPITALYFGYTDVYAGPYKAKHRYWTGLLLLVKVTFLPIFFINFTNNPGSNLLAIAVMSSILLACLAFAGGVYKNMLNNVFEIASLPNLLLLSVATLYVVFTGQSRIAITYISTGVAFTIFAVVVYHAAWSTTKEGKRD